MIGLLDVSVDMLRDLPSFLPRGWTVIGSALCERHGSVRFVVSNQPDTDEIPTGHAAIPLLTMTISDAADVRMITMEVG